MGGLQKVKGPVCNIYLDQCAENGIENIFRQIMSLKINDCCVSFTDIKQLYLHNSRISYEEAAILRHHVSTVVQNVDLLRVS